MEFLNGFSVPVIVGICLCVGYILKNVVTSDKVNKFIPLIMGVIGLGLNVWINLAVSPDIILGGMASGLASTGAHQLVTQLLKGKE